MAGGGGKDKKGSNVPSKERLMGQDVEKNNYHALRKIKVYPADSYQETKPRNESHFETLE